MVSRQGAPVGEEKFLGQYSFALIGFSRNGKKFGNHIYRRLSKKGMNILPINPSGEIIDGVQTYKSLLELPVNPQAVVIAVKASSVEAAVREVIEAGIKRVWVIGSGYTKEVEKLCEANGIEMIHNRCILMYFGGFPHNLHYALHRLWRRTPRISPRCEFYDTLGEWVSFQSEHDGSEEKFWLGLPEGFDGDARNTAALYLHQQGSDWSGVLTSGMYDHCRERGIITVSTDYRGMDSHLNPAALADIEQVIAKLREDYGVTRWICTGVSMGAISSIQLTYLLPEELRPSGVVAVLPVYDIPRFYSTADEQFRRAIAESYGGSPEENPESYRKRSPHENIGRIDKAIPFAIFAGRNDDVAPMEIHSQPLVRALEKNGNPVLYEELEVDHDPEVFSECHEKGLRYVIQEMAEEGAGNVSTGV